MDSTLLANISHKFEAWISEVITKNISNYEKLSLSKLNYLLNWTSIFISFSAYKSWFLKTHLIQNISVILSTNKTD